MKNVLLMIALLVSGSIASANLTTVGASNMSACMARTSEARVEAENQAKKAADEGCRMDGNKVSVKLDVETLFQRGGSCWAGANNNVAVVYHYECRRY